LLIDKEAREKPGSPHSDVGWGLFWMLGGAALLVALYVNSGRATSLYALIPIAIGLHYLIYYFTVGRKEASAFEAERKANAQRSLTS
jgi:cadmium resistance protein CadD (predicted permease)